MSHSPQWQAEMLELISAIREDPTDDMVRARLRARIAEDREICRFYIRHVHLAASLNWSFGMGAIAADPFAQTANQMTSVRIKPRRTSLLGFLRQSSIAATLLVAGIVYGTFGLCMWQMSRYELAEYTGTATIANNSPKGGQGAVVAKLIDGSDCIWREESAAPHIGSMLHAGILHLASGIADIEFINGARVVIQGPADFELRSAGRGSLELGKLVANVPKQAVGFTLDTPTGSIIDLGTEFGVEVTDTGATKVQVFQGRVDIVPHNSACIATDQREVKGRQQLVAGQISTTAFIKEEATSLPTAAFRDFLHRVRTEKSATVRDGNQRFIASDVEQGVNGNHAPWNGTIGMDFDVLMPIEIHRLGVFDSGSDGIDPSSRPTVEIWSRDTSGTPASQNDDRAGKRLAHQEFSTASPGQLVGGNRFKPLETPLRLEPGAYTMLAWGFSQSNRAAMRMINGIAAGDNLTKRPMEVAGIHTIKMWITDNHLPTKREYIVFDLTGQPDVTEHIATVKVWNSHDWEPAAWRARGVKEITIQRSLDGNVWSDVINPATKTLSFALSETSETEGQDSEVVDILSLGSGIDTRFIRFNVQGRFGDGSLTDNPHPGLSEVRFFGGQPFSKRWVLDDGDGLLSFLPRARVSSQESGVFPTKLNHGAQVSRFLAGTFEFSATIEPTNADASQSDQTTN